MEGDEDENRESLHHVIQSLHYRLENLERKFYKLMDIVQEVTQAVETLKTDLTGKLEEVHAELNKLESEKGGSPALTAARDLITGLDTTVKGFKAAPDPSGTGTGGTGGGEKPKPTKSVYTFTGTGTPDATVWPTAPFKTNKGTQLYYYSQDTAPGTTSGIGQPGWELYSGEAVPA